MRVASPFGPITPMGRICSRRPVTGFRFKQGELVYDLAPKLYMQRLIATFTLLLVGWTTAGSAAIAFAGPAIPLCCQKHGKHHCTGMPDESRDGAGPSFKAYSPPCPYRTQIVRLSSHFQWGSPNAARSGSLQPDSWAVRNDSPYPYALYVNFFFKRGPPSFLSSDFN